MSKTMKEEKNKTLYFPVDINKEEDWSYWGEAKFFDGCFSDGNNLEELGNNMVYAIQTYSDSIKEWFFDAPNTGILAINFDENGKVKNNSLKRIDENSYKVLSWS